MVGIALLPPFSVLDQESTGSVLNIHKSRIFCKVFILFPLTCPPLFLCVCAGPVDRMPTGPGQCLHAGRAALIQGAAEGLFRVAPRWRASGLSQARVLEDRPWGGLLALLPTG